MIEIGYRSNSKKIKMLDCGKWSRKRNEMHNMNISHSQKKNYQENTLTYLNRTLIQFSVENSNETGTPVFNLTSS